MLLIIIGLVLDAIGALVLVLADPPRHQSRLLKLRYLIDRYYPPVARVKAGFDHLVSGGVIYKSEEDARAEEPYSRIAIGERPVYPKVLLALYRVTALRDRFPLLFEGYGQPISIHPKYELYKVERLSELESEEGGTNMIFSFKWTGSDDPTEGIRLALDISDKTIVRNLVTEEGFAEYPVPEEKFVEYLVQYTNGAYVRLGAYLLIAGFGLQIISTLLS